MGSGCTFNCAGESSTISKETSILNLSFGSSSLSEENKLGDLLTLTYHFLGTMTNGGPQQICGGLSFISIYNNTDPSFVANGSNKNSAGNVPQDLPVVTKPNYVGCATDNYNNTGRTLTGASLSQLNMSSSICQNFCATAQGGRGWQYWGTEYETHQNSQPLSPPASVIC